MLDLPGRNYQGELVTYTEKEVAELLRCYPEPPDGTRIEFQEYGAPGGDVIGIHRDDASSGRAGWSTGDGGEVWCEYGRSVPFSWAEMLQDPRLAAAVNGQHLVPAPPSMEQQPTP